jgi:hypothetical protein
VALAIHTPLAVGFFLLKNDLLFGSVSLKTHQEVYE